MHVPKGSPRHKSATMRAQKRREERAGIGEAMEHLQKTNKVRAIVGQQPQPASSSIRYENDPSATKQVNEALRKRKAALK